MRTLLASIATFIPFAAHSVVATTSPTDPGGPDLAYSFVGGMSGASAVAVGPHLVLTAGHVAAGDFWLGSDVYHMTSTEIAPDWKKRDVDLRLVTVAETLPGWYTVADSVKKGASITMVGYGQSGVVNATGTGYDLSYDGARHAGVNAVSSKETTTGFGPTLRAMLDGPGDAVLGIGDSGGGWFSNGQLVGISAFTFTKKTNKPDYGWAKTSYFGSGAIDLTNVSLNTWLDVRTTVDVITKPPISVGLDFSVEAVPEPAPLAALALGAGAALRRKRR